MRLRTVNFYESALPHQLRESLWHKALSVVGALLLMTAIGLGAALVSWSVLDPSLSHAGDAEVQNWLGAPGAIVSDLLVQFFGLAAVAPIMMIAGWGWRLTAGRPLTRPLRRLLLTVIAMALVGGFLSSLPAPESWPLLVGLGGVLGDGAALALKLPLGFASGILGPEIEAALAALIALLAAAALAYATGMTLPGRARSQRAARPSRRNARDADDGDEEDFDDDITAPQLGRAIWRGFLGLLAAIWWIMAGLAKLMGPLWRRLMGQSGIDPKDRLRLAMERADREDLTWSNSAELYAPNRRRQLSEAIEEHDLEFDDRGPVRRLIDRASDVIHAMLAFRDADRENEPLVRAEPQLGAGWDEIDLEVAEESAPTAQPAARKRAPRARKPAAPEFDFDDCDEYQLPPLALLNEAPPPRPEDAVTPQMLEENARMLEGVLDDFGIRGQIIDVRPGPVVTLYELEPAPGLKSSRVIGLADDIARSMSAISARVAVVPGRNAIGIELPNERRETVYLQEVLASKAFASDKHSLALTLGKDIGGQPIIADLARMPHLLIAGTTGSGKSVGINTMILSLLFRMTPDQCKMIMIDPKMLELSVYDGIPHLLSPVVTDPKKAIVALKWTVREMEARYKNMSKVGVRNIDGFNKRVRDAEERGEVLSRTVQTGFDRDTGEAIYETEEMSLQPMPYIVVVVDEMADLMMVAGKEIEGAIQRLAQMARAAGIHIIMATQRPSVDVITGTIKANFPTRISFQVTSRIDSRTILGEQGAEQLLGQGDMLYMAGGGRISRVHGAFVSDEEVESAVQFLKRQGIPEYLDAVTADTDDGGTGDGEDFMAGLESGGTSEADQLYDQAVAVVARDRKASTSYIQRRLSIGYNRAATIIERMEDEGVVGAANHAGKREILVPEPSFEND